MFGFGLPELVIVLVIVMVVFGAGKLADVGGALGKGLSNFKKGLKDDDAIENQAKTDDKGKRES
jgi:sec-independent protein translocase protein TatA